MNSEQTDYEVRALRELVNELRDEPEPKLDWDRVESSLMAKIADAQPLRPAASATHENFSRVAGFAAVAAAVALIVALQSANSPNRHSVHAEQAVDLSNVASVRESNDALPTYLVSGLQPSAVVESDQIPVRFDLPGVVSWTLDPDSRVKVLTTTAPHVVTLERGAIHAEVVPRHDSNQMVESFIVEAGSTRVAVHGTVFSVERLADRVLVEVTRGSVTVGPAGHRGVTTGRLLVGPAKAAFSLENGELLETLAARPDPSEVVAATDDPAPAVEAPVAADTDGAPKAVARVQSPAPAPSVAPETAPDSNPEPVVNTPQPLSVDQARGVMLSCLIAASRSETPRKNLITISTQVSLKLGGDGMPDSVRFNPPLRPEWQDRCAGVLFGREIDANGQVDFSVLFQPQ